MARGTLGNVVVKLPLPAGCLPTLWNADERFRQAYLEEFPGFYKTADAGMIDEDGYLYVMSRTDDIINVAGHRLSTGAMEEVLSAHPDVAECAVIGIADAMKGQIPLGFVVLNAGVSRDTGAIESEVVGLVRERIGPVAAFKTVVTIKRLPKTRSGKILRGTMQKIADKEEWTMPATIDDPGHSRRDHRGAQSARHRGLTARVAETEPAGSMAAKSSRTAIVCCAMQQQTLKFARGVIPKVRHGSAQDDIRRRRHIAFSRRRDGDVLPLRLLGVGVSRRHFGARHRRHPAASGNGALSAPAGSASRSSSSSAASSSPSAPRNRRRCGSSRQG